MMRRSARSGFQPSAVFVGLVGLWAIAGVMAWQDFGSRIFNVILFVVAGWIVSLSLHEYAHALTAYRSGDHSVVGAGYLTLNPLKYTHPFLSIVLPVVFLLIGGFGLPGGAVFIDRHAIRGKWRNSLISLAGPGINVAFLIAMVIPFAIGAASFAHLTFWSAWAFLAFLQLMAAGLNLLPVPGLDGGNALRPWLNPKWGRGFDLVAPYGMLLLILVLFEPRVNFIFFFVLDTIADIIGLPLGLVGEGQRILLFWR